MSSVYDLHLRSSSLSDPASGQAPPDNLGQSRPGETSGERRLRRLRTVLGDLRTKPER